MSRFLRSLAVTLACLAALATPLAVSAHSRDGRPGRTTAGRLARSAAQRTDSDAAVEADRVAYGTAQGVAQADATALRIITDPTHEPHAQPCGPPAQPWLPVPGAASGQAARPAREGLPVRLPDGDISPRGPPSSL